MAFYSRFVVRVLENQNGCWRCAQNSCNYQIKFFLLDCDVIWHEKCYHHFFLDDNGSIWNLYGQVPESFCWWLECSQSDLRGTYKSSLISAYEVEIET